MLLQALRLLSFPLFLAVTLGGGLWLVSHQAGPLSYLLLLTALNLAIVLLERAIPFAPAWNQPQGDQLGDIAYFVANLLLNPVIGVLSSGLWGRLGTHWPLEWPLWAQATLALLGRELGHYAIHRYTHERGGLLWRFHSIHHQPGRLYWLNANRMHVGNLLVDALTGFVPLMLLGAGREAMTLAGLVVAAMNLVTHANIDFRAGPLVWVFNLPENHRWHHLRPELGPTCNHGDVLVLWD